MATQARTVLVFLSSTGNFAMRRQAGIWRTARARGWRLHTLIYSMRPGGGYRLHRSPAGGSVAEVLDFWRPDGCIVDCCGGRDAIPGREFRKTPTVFLDPPSQVGKKDRAVVFSDESSIARVAGEELIRSGFGDLAWVPWPGRSAWSRERGRAFAAFAEASGRRFHAFSHPRGALETERMSQNLLPWLRGLPKPVGVFAANDAAAEAVLVACASLGIHVPDKVGVIGADDLEYICENTSPTLSSIQRDFVGAGVEAATLLGDLMDAPEKTFTSRQYGALRVVRRESTRFEKMRNWRVAKALEFIRLHACSGIGPKDVAKAMFISRPMADDAFRKEMGSTILAQIHAVRLDTAKDMLLRGLRPDIVAQECGYSSTNDFRRVFKHRLGTTIGKWLKERQTMPAK